MKIKYFLFLGVILIAFACQNNAEKSENKSQKQEKVEQKQVDSLEILNTSIRQNPLNDLTRYKRARLYYQKADYNNALSDMGKAIQLNPSNLNYIIFLSDIYQGINKFEDARDLLKKVVDKAPKNIEAKLKLAKLELAFNDHKQAIINVNRALKIEPNHAKALYLKGIINLEKGNKQTAMLFFRKSVESDPKFTEPYIQLGILHSEQKEDIAIDYFNTVLNMHPQDMATMYLLAMHYQENNMPNKALSTYKNMISIDSSNAMAYHNMGYIYLVYKKEYENAIAQFSEAIKINPKYYQAYSNRGLAYELLKNKAKAKENYQEALKIERNFDKAIEGLNRL